MILLKAANILINDNFIEKKSHEASLSYSMMLFYESGEPNCLFLNTSLARSMTIRIDTKGLKHIHPVIKEYDHLYNMTRIHVYKVDWAEFLAEIGEEN